MSKKPKEETTSQQLVFKPGTYFSILQLPIDLAIKPVAQRIVQFVVKTDTEAACYMTENCYMPFELVPLMEKLMTESYADLHSTERPNELLKPVKGKVHWVLLTQQSYDTGRGIRMNPMTGEAE